MTGLRKKPLSGTYLSPALVWSHHDKWICFFFLSHFTTLDVNQVTYDIVNRVIDWLIDWPFPTKINQAPLQLTYFHFSQIPEMLFDSFFW